MQAAAAYYIMLKYKCMSREIPTRVPVETPQPRRHALSGGTVWSIFVTWATSTTVYSDKLETNRKWNKGCPVRSVNLLVSCLGIQVESLKGNFEHRLLFDDRQSAQSPQSDKKVGMTASPSLTSSTFSPTLSTTLQTDNLTFLSNVHIRPGSKS